MKTSTNQYTIIPRDMFYSSDDRAYDIRVRDLDKDKRPHEKIHAHGPDELSNQELLAAVLYTGTRKEGVLQMASRILQEYGDNYITQETNPKRLSEFFDIPISKATQIIAAFTLGKRLFVNPKKRSITIRTARDAYHHVKDMSHLPKEHLRGLYLNSRYQLVHEEVISVGTVSGSLIHPREVFRPAIERNAVAVILAHNHPSGDTTPSSEDIAVTEQLIQAGKMIGIDIIDHLVIGEKGFTSVPATYSS